MTDTVLVALELQTSLVEVAQPTLLTAEGLTALQVLEVLGTPVTQLLTVAEESVTLLTAAEQGPAGTSDAAYTHSQAVASAVWTAAHNLGKYPAVTVADNLRAPLLADVSYVDLNTVQVAFSSARTGFVFFS